jgi:hypothetical protein
MDLLGSETYLSFLCHANYRSKKYQSLEVGQCQQETTTDIWMSLLQTNTIHSSSTDVLFVSTYKKCGATLKDISWISDV